MDQHKTPNKNAHVQRGVYAVEWAIVFPVFFMLVYAIISYGLTLLVRESMQNAVEDGARAALRYQGDRDARFLKVQDAVLERLSWLPESLRPEGNQVSVQLCQLEQQTNCDLQLQCDASAGRGCVIKVGLQIPYKEAAFAPALPGLGVLLPEHLSASASILVDPGGF